MIDLDDTFNDAVTVAILSTPTADRRDYGWAGAILCLILCAVIWLVASAFSDAIDCEHAMCAHGEPARIKGECICVDRAVSR